MPHILLLCVAYELVILLFSLRATAVESSFKTPPHILFILVDDLGFNDVSYNGRLYGSAIRTPNIDRLARKGVILNNYYVQPICSPTRSQLLTGRYQIHTGLQHSTIGPTRPHCIPLDEITLAQKLKEFGYATHMIGKWHLGFYKKECLPTSRGFDTFLGFYLGSQDYYKHTSSYKKQPFAYDFHRDVGQNTKIARQYDGKYSTHIFAQKAQKMIRQHNQSIPLFLYLAFQAPHGPLQVPSRYKRKYVRLIQNKERRTLAAMIACLDEAIGAIFRTLKDAGLYKNSVVIFSTDNGGATGLGNNWPLRGSKGTLWEGAMRGIGFVLSPFLPKKVKGSVSQAFIHVSDWFPTIVSSLAGGNLNGTKPLDGYDVWDAIANNAPSPRMEVLHNIDTRYPRPVKRDKKFHFETAFRASLRVGDWKIITGNPGDDNGWTAPPESDLISVELSEPADKHLWLFNISADPYEMHDVSENNTYIVEGMLRRLRYHYDTMVPPLYPDPDENYNPADLGGVWEPWWDKVHPSKPTTD